MSASRELYEKNYSIIRNYDRIVFAAIALLNNIIITIFLYKIFKSDDAISGKVGMNEYFIFIAILFFSTVLFSAITFYIENRIKNKMINSSSMRNELLKSNFIEGEYFVATFNIDRLLEYTLVEICFENFNFKILGEIFRIKQNSILPNKENDSYNFNDLEYIGLFYNKVGEFFQDIKSFFYDYDRISRYENKDTEIDVLRDKKRIVKLNKSSGRGEYIFQFDENLKMNNRIMGNYYDPEQDSLMFVKGYRTDYLISSEKAKEKFKAAKSSGQKIILLHEEFSKLHKELSW